MASEGTFDGVGVSRSDPVAWSTAWDAFLEKRFQPLPSYPDMAFLSSYAPYLLSQTHLASVDQNRKELAELQSDLAGLVHDKRVSDQFDSKWLSMSPETRHEHLLQGLLDASGATVDMEERRQWCPETRMALLEGNGGKGFLDILTTICPVTDSEPHPRKDPILISHPVFDAIYHIGEPPAPGENAAVRDVMQRSTSLTRNYFLSLFAWCTVLHIYGMKQEYGASKNGINITEDLKHTKAVRDPMISPGELKALRNEVKEAYKGADWHCTNCSKRQSDLPAGQKFLQCSKCGIIGRKIVYCDRDCQVNDWKKGNPPHKTFCGKDIKLPGTLETTPIASKDTTSAFPPPDPGFIRSPALVHQLSLLQDNPNLSYVLTQPDPKPDHGIRFADATGGLFFKIMFNRAIKNGDPGAVARMASQLELSAKNVGISRPRLLVQLGKEYGIGVEKLDKLCQSLEDRSTTDDAKQIDDLSAKLEEQMRIGSA